MKKIGLLKFNRLILPFLGLASLIWFLIRVIPKPSRASYPCMRTAAPLASSFVLYIVGLLATAYIFTRAKLFFQRSKYALFGLALICSIVVAFTTMSSYNEARAYRLVDETSDGPNQPMGTGVGVMPGRVAWIYNPDAVNENCPNTENKDGSNKDYWYMDKNTNRTIVSKMFVDGLKMVTNTTSEEVAWDSIFHYYNRTHGRGNVGYTAGEKIVIKLNQNGGSSPKAKINTSPQLIYAILNSLINVVKVAQADIIYGDPISNTGNVYYDSIHAAFADVKCYGTGTGRTANVTSSVEKITSSESATAHSTYMPQSFVDATYMINVPVFKKHHRAGISLASKLHFGSLGASEGGAWNWHFSLPAPDGAGNVSNGDYGSYRCFVDMMGYKHLGAKTILFVIDGLWSSTNWGHPSIKWRMAPFNNDYPSSLFLSQDQVAVESVGFDFLFKEFDANHPTEGVVDAGDNKGPHPHFAGTDDFLHQAADKNNWASGVTYDPDGDGVALPASMGTHEHWNNAEEKKYSRNLGQNKGIELVTNQLLSLKNTTASNNYGLKNSPNPFSAYTTFVYNLTSTADVELVVYDIKGSMIRELVDLTQEAGTHEIRWDGLDESGMNTPSGIYMAKIIVRVNNNLHYQVVKVIKK